MGKTILSSLFILIISLTIVVIGEETKIHVIDAGKGDAVLLQTSGTNVLIDAGSDRNSTAQYLVDKNITDVTFFLVTGYSMDKAGGILEVMNRTIVHEYRDFYPDNTVLSCQRVHNRLSNESIRYTPLTEGEKIHVGEGVDIEVLPINQSGQEPKEALLKITSGNISTLLLNKDPAPDISISEPIQVLRVADHGSRKGYDARFIRTINPEVAIITGGRSEPNQATIMGLEAYGAEVLRTDIRGTVLVTTDGERYNLATNRSSPSGGMLSLVSVIETRPPG